ncbi:protein-S-isoprenylcysteine O-methyltransferase [Zeugodacus cucurbitae]|uniref:Protein-S-isoprenylcysteine O-methyltransferase n=1 Tax=Zeugodacus cucurbitae TaxID=28588 RepID=A0A0A1XI35_ZEUCU|nr:protein-S-isoprenylcysteine O-methyltransferase [Zeugodacus cucurbitae]
MSTGQRTTTMDNKLCHEGRLSLYCYLTTTIIVLMATVPQIYFGTVPNVWGAAMWGPVLYYALINMVIRYLLRDNDYQIAIRSTFLGFMEAVSILVILFAPNELKQFGVYALFMAFFHYSEFLAIAWCNPNSLSTDSFILNHSIHYAIAAIASWIEFALEVWLLPSFKDFYYIWLLGVVLCATGEIIRKVAMITARNSFTHLVQHEKADNHKLITHGIYAYMRHPSYVGWFWWSVGTQIILLNPVCILIYTVVSWKFFHDRIFMEEITLLNFFRSDYHKYQQNVPTGLPFIKGYTLD